MTRQEIWEKLADDTTFKSLQQLLHTESARDVVLDNLSISEAKVFKSVEAAVIYINYLLYCRYIITTIENKLLAKGKLTLDDYLIIPFKPVEADDLDAAEDDEVLLFFKIMRAGEVKATISVTFKSVAISDEAFEQEAQKDSPSYSALPVYLAIRKESPSVKYQFGRFALSVLPVSPDGKKIKLGQFSPQVLLDFIKSFIDRNIKS